MSSRRAGVGRGACQAYERRAPSRAVKFGGVMQGEKYGPSAAQLESLWFETDCHP